MDLEGWLPNSQSHTFCPYPEPDKSSLRLSNPIFEDPLQYLHFHLRLVPPSSLFLSDCPPDPWTHLLSLTYENWDTFYLLWDEKQNVICSETMNKIFR
jgi:hypothetical protein